MHPALAISEILAQIFELAGTPGPESPLRKESLPMRRDLLAAALTCRCWSSLALDALWNRYFTDVKHLLPLLPPYPEVRAVFQVFMVRLNECAFLRTATMLGGVLPHTRVECGKSASTR